MEMDLPLPERIGPYRVTGRLGRGGMGEVLRGHDDRLDRPVALKRVLPDVREPERALKRFRREARAVARLNHPSIVQVYDWEEHEGQHWLVLELVEGRSLHEMVAEGPLGVERALAIARDVASGLAEAHEAGLVHRDLKPSNVIVNARDTAKILDFGLAKTVRLEDSGTDRAAVPSSTLTGAGSIVGTVTAMSPEQAMGKKVDHRSDLFSLGILLYEMLSGVPPFKGDSAIETLTRICSAQEEPLRQLDPEIPQGVANLVAQLLQKDPDKRPRDARAVVAWIDRVDTAPAADSQETTLFGSEETLPLRQSGKEARSRRWLWGLSAAVAVVALGLWGLTSWRGSLNGEVASDGAAVGTRQPEAERTPYELYQSGMALLDRSDHKGNIDKAIAEFQKALAQDQQFAPALAGLARAYRLDNYWGSKDPQRLNQALAAAEQAVRADGHLAQARVSLGWVSFAMGRYDEAVQAFKKALEMEPSNCRAVSGLGKVYEAQSDPQEAEDHFRRASECQAEEAEHLGAFYYNAGRYDEAAAAFQRYLEKIPDSFIALSDLGAIRYMQGDLSEAARMFQQALLIRQDPSLYSNIGTIYFAQGLYAPSVSAFEKAIENGGANEYMLWGNLGDAYRWSPEHEGAASEAYLRAIQLLDEDLAGKPGDLTLRTRRILYLAKRGDCEQALAAADKTAELLGDDGTAFFRLAVTREVCARRDEALAALDAALQAHYPIEEVQLDPELRDLRQDVRYHKMAIRYPTKEDA